MAGPDDTGLPAPQALDDPYASLSLPYASWWSPPPSSGPVPAAQPPPVDQTQAAPPPADMPAVAPPTPLAPPADLSQLGTAGPDGTVGGRPAVSQQLDASGKLIQPPTAGAEPVLPYGAITPDRAPADIAGPLSVGEAMNDQTRGVGQLAPAEKAPTPEEKWANDPLNPQAAKEVPPDQLQRLTDAYAVRDPAGYAGDSAKYKENARQEALKRVSEEKLADAQRAQNEWVDYQKAQAETQAEHQKMLADAEALAKEKVDPEHWKNTRSPLQLIAAGLSLVAGAIHQGTGGKTNPGLDIINKAIDDDNKAQSENLASRRALLGMKMTDNREQRIANQQDFTMLTSRRIAMHQQVIDAIDTDLQNYNPQGMIAQAYTAAKAQQKAAQLQASNAWVQQTLKNKLDISKDDRETYTAQQTARHQKAEEALGWAKEKREAATAKAAKTPEPIYTADALTKLLPPGSTPPPKDWTGTVADYTKLAEAGSKGIENQQKINAGTIHDPNTGKAIPDAQGQPTLIAEKPGDKAGPNEKLAATKNLVDTLARARRFLDSDPSTIDRSAWAGMTTDIQDAKKHYINIAGGKLSSREMDSVEDAFGPNFESYTDRITQRGPARAHIDHLIDGAMGEVATNIRTETGLNLKYDRSKREVVDEKGNAVIVDTSQPLGAPKNEIDKLIEQTRSKAPGESHAAALDLGGGQLGDQLVNQGNAQRSDAISALAAAYGARGATKEQKQQITEALKGLSDNGYTSETKAAAADALRSLK